MVIISIGLRQARKLEQKYNIVWDRILGLDVSRLRWLKKKWPTIERIKGSLGSR